MSLLFLTDIRISTSSFLVAWVAVPAATVAATVAADTVRFSPDCRSFQIYVHTADLACPVHPIPPGGQQGGFGGQSGGYGAPQGGYGGQGYGQAGGYAAPQGGYGGPQGGYG